MFLRRNDSLIRDPAFPLVVTVDMSQIGRRRIFWPTLNPTLFQTVDSLRASLFLLPCAQCYQISGWSDHLCRNLCVEKPSKNSKMMTIKMLISFFQYAVWNYIINFWKIKAGTAHSLILVSNQIYHQSLKRATNRPWSSISRYLPSSLVISRHLLLYSVISHDIPTFSGIRIHRHPHASPGCRRLIIRSVE